ncbi:MAG TPA: diacylglycerol kinase family protein [Caldimonas sp.]|jgi:diacylglycerol kinase family enzyme|nr:diacylglycerol kinase family protein [Caldimonas sp.]HEX2541914.1 diacylglycerol kinase family protein [Caldimonas sp.]
MSDVPAPARRIVVVLNAGSGQGSAEQLEERVADAFRAAGADAEIRLAHGGAEIEAALDAAVRQSPDVIVAAGGDGTVSAVGAALAGSAIAMGVLPLGTLNHFAKDFGVPLELEAAVEHVVHGRPVRVDVGEVNGRVFVNNSSLGLYADIVRDRERQQKRLGRGKWPALVWATLSALRRYPFLSVRLLVDGQERLWRTPFVFVGNNEYTMEGFAIGERAGIQDGRLSLYVAQRPGRLRLLLLVLRALIGGLRQARDFSAMTAAEIVVESRHHRLRVATDGEVTVMTPPLTYRIRPSSLGVMRADSDLQST